TIILRTGVYISYYLFEKLDIKARETSPLTAEQIELIKKEYPEGLFKGIHTEVHHIYDPNGLVYTFEMPSRRYRNKKE
ncbi:MAG: hypothetical protein AABX33_01700, partial [Nanoarchaeota archaeon]